MLLTAVLAGGAVWLLTRTPPPRVVRSALLTAPSAAPSFTDMADVNVAIAPDGSWVAYVGNDATQLFVRALDAIQPTAIVTTPAYLRGVFVSDDGLWLGYVENNFTLRKVSVAGGAPATVVAMDGPSRGAAWSSERGIVFATGAFDSGLQRVDPSGGSVTVLTKPDAGRGEGDHLFPAFLPDHRHVLFTILPPSGVLDAAQIAVLDLETGAWKTLLKAATTADTSRAAICSTPAAERCGPSPSTCRAWSLGARRWRWRLTLVTSNWGLAVFSVAGDGTLVYADAPGGVSSDRTLVWVDRDGRETTLDLRAATYSTPRISPDGTRLAVSDGDLWLVDLAHPTAEPTRLTFAPRDGLVPGMDARWPSPGLRILAWRWVQQPLRSIGRGRHGRTADDEPGRAAAYQHHSRRYLGRLQPVERPDGSACSECSSNHLERWRRCSRHRTTSTTVRSPQTGAGWLTRESTRLAPGSWRSTCGLSPM